MGIRMVDSEKQSEGEQRFGAIDCLGDPIASRLNSLLETSRLFLFLTSQKRQGAEAGQARLLQFV